MKSSTQQTLDYIKQIEDYINSSAYKSQIAWQDINSDVSSYKHWDQTLGEGIVSLLESFKLIKNNLSTYDKWSYDQRNAINTSYLVNLLSWIQNPIWNFTNIIQYANNITSALFNLGINSTQKLPNAKDIKKLVEEISTAREIIWKSDEINALLGSLKEIKDWWTKIEQAKEIISFVETTKNISEINSYVEWGKSRIESLLESARKLLWTASDAIIAQHFSEASEKYKNELSFELPVSFVAKNIDIKFWGWFKKDFLTFLYNIYYYALQSIVLVLRIAKGLLNWNFFVIIGVSLFIVNLLVVFHYKGDISIIIENKDSIPLQIIWIIANWLIRLTCLTPSIFLLWFILQNRNHKEKLRETYEFRAVSSKTIQWHIEMLMNNGITWDKLHDFIVHAFTNIYTEPDFSKKQKEESGLLDTDKFSKLVDTFEKLKWIIKN